MNFDLILVIFSFDCIWELYGEGCKFWYLGIFRLIKLEFQSRIQV